VPRAVGAAGSRSGATTTKSVGEQDSRAPPLALETDCAVTVAFGTVIVLSSKVCKQIERSPMDFTSP